MVTNFESIVLESPFLMSNSSIGERQDVGGFSSLTGLPRSVRSPWNASSNALICSALRDFGFNFSSNSATSHNSLAALPETPEKFRRRNVVILASEDSPHNRWSCPSSIPLGWGLIASTRPGNFSVTRGQ